MSATSAAKGSRGYLVLAALIGMLIPAAWLWTTVTPGEDLVRLRNALGAEVGELSDFTWGPDDPPETYLRNQGSVPSVFERIADGVTAGPQRQSSGEFDLALAISRDLMKAPKRIGGPVREESASTYTQITERGRGYCADFAKVFNGMAIAADVPVRQWGFAFNGFGSGHTFNEIYDASREKWLMVDSFHSLYFVDPESRQPLSVIEVHDRLLNLGEGGQSVAVEHIVPDRFPFRSDELAIDYYRRGMPQLWLVWGNNVFDYEASWPGKAGSAIHRSVGQLGGIVFHKYPTIRIYPRGLSRRDLEELAEGRNEFVMAVVALVLAVGVFGVGLVTIRRRTGGKDDNGSR